MREKDSSTTTALGKLPRHWLTASSELKQAAMALAIMLFYSYSATSATFTVNSIDGGTSAGTLRWAIAQANAAAGPHTISFSGLTAVAASGPYTINLGVPLDDLTRADVTVDGTTAPGYNCATGIPMVIVIGGGYNTFEVSGANCIIRAISWRTHKVDLVANNVRMYGCWFNLNNAGTGTAGAGPGNNFLVLNGCTNCIVGGTGCGERNVISGFGGSFASGNVNVQNSSGSDFVNTYLGTDYSGMTLLNNTAGEGYLFDNTNSDILMDGCVIAGCLGTTPDGYGIHVVGGTYNNLTIQNCKIGTNSAGNASPATFGNNKAGIYLRGAGTGIMIQNNIICNNGRGGASFVDDSGIAIQGSGTNSGTIQNNYIGVDNTYALGGNRFYGLYFYQNASAFTVQGNVVGDNGNNASATTYGGGITAAVNSNVTNITIRANYVGVSPTSLDIGNYNNGIHFEGTGTPLTNFTVGGASAADANYVCFNKGLRTSPNAGIYLYATTNVQILNNYIGVTPAGGNGGQKNGGGHARGGNGVYVEYSGNALVRIGSMTAMNTISYNAGNGINVFDADFVEMRWNSMFCNTEKAIDLNCAEVAALRGNSGFGCTDFTITGVGSQPYSSLTGNKPANSLVDVFGTHSCASGGSCLPHSQYRYGGIAADALTTWTYNHGSPMVDDLSANATGSGANCSSGFCRTSELKCVDNPLPVSLISFKAKDDGNFVLLTWETGFEENNDYFILERSYDGEHFEPIAKIDGAGSSRTVLPYNYTDAPAPGQTVVYYKLKQVDFDGTTASPGIVAVNRDKSGDLLVFPNPNNGSFNIALNVLEGTEAVITLSDVSGREITKRYEKISDNNIPELVIGDLAPGVYVLTVTTDISIYSETIFVK